MHVFMSSGENREISGLEGKGKGGEGGGGGGGGEVVVVEEEVK